MPDDRAELLAALNQITAFTEGLLMLSERLLRAYDTDARPSAEELEAMRDGVVRWREQLEGFKQRLAAVTVLGNGPLPLPYPRRGRSTPPARDSYTREYRPGHQIR
jgi:hypothetical protein